VVKPDRATRSRREYVRRSYRRPVAAADRRDVLDLAASAMIWLEASTFQQDGNHLETAQNA